MDNFVIKFKWVRGLVLFLLFFNIFFFIMRKCNIKNYFSVMATYDEGNIVFIIPVDYLQELLKMRKVRIDRKNYSFRLIEIDEELLLVDGNFFKKVVIQVALPKKLAKKNNTFSIFLSYEEKNIFHILESCFKE